MVKACTCALLYVLGSAACAQFVGGIGHGVAMASILPTPVYSDIFSGGDGRGEVLAAIPITAVFAGSYSGGNGHGEVAAGFTVAPIFSAVFSGGNGRGDRMASLPVVPIVSNIHGGGNGRGDLMALIPFAPIFSNLHSGGNGRGDAAAFIAPAPIPSDIFAGGQGRGDVMAAIPVSAIPTDIFSGGNGRGDRAALIQATPIPSDIFSGGSGRGDRVALIQATPIPTDIFSGGNGRGDVVALIQSTPLPSDIFSGGNGRGDVVARFSPALQVLLSLRGMLEGPYSASAGLMSDALRSASLIPGTEPYSALGYAASSGGGETVASATLATTGNNAIVDWVVVELRDNANPATVLASHAALIQRDGDVVSTNGTTPVLFDQAPGTYRVALRHRNHLGVMTLNPITLGATITSVDFTVASTQTYGTNARKSITGTFSTLALWAGDVTFNNQLKYAGSNNDRDPILTAIGGTVPTNTLSGQYRKEDITMNGQVKYAGSANDRDILLQNIGGSVPTATRNAQLP